MEFDKQRPNSTNWFELLTGWLGVDIYSTAWVALVPGASDNSIPAWSESLDYLRAHQLPDGGWGEPHIYYAHERTITTLAVIRALHFWKFTRRQGQDRGWNFCLSKIFNRFVWRTA